jgi:hypothetical protein
MIEKSLGCFAFDRIVFNQFDGNGLLIMFVNTEVNIAEAAFPNTVRPLEKILIYFLDGFFRLTYLGYHASVLLVHAWVDHSLNLALILI